MGKSLQKYNPERFHFTPDLEGGHAQHLLVQLSATPGTVTTIPVPSWATFIKLYALTGNLFYTADETPAVGEAKTDTALAASDCSVGDFVPALWLETRIPSTNVQTLYLAGDSASMQVYVSFSAGSLTVR